MNNFDIQLLLDEIRERNFLNSIELIYKKNPEYKKSDFYKNTRIPLEILYEKYFHFYNANYSLTEKMEAFIEGVNPDTLSNIIISTLEKLESNENFKEKIIKILENFNIEELMKQNEEIDKLIKDLK